MPFLFCAAYQRSWNSLVRPAVGFAIITLLWLVGAGSLWAFTSVRVALDSNILVDGKRVIFAQGTGSLTVLNLETGEVLLRKKPASNVDYSGRLQRSIHGVLMVSYGRIEVGPGPTRRSKFVG